MSRAKMTYKELIERIGVVVDDAGLLLHVYGDEISIEGKFFNYSVLNRMQRILQLYGECEWWIYPAEYIENGVMYRIKIFKEI